MAYTGFGNSNYNFSDNSTVEPLVDVTSVWARKCGRPTDTGNIIRMSDITAHPIGKHIDAFIENPDDIHAETQIHHHLADDILNTLKMGKLIDKTQIVKDSFNQQKYSRLANSSYDHFNSGGDVNAVEKGLKNEAYDHLGLKDFKVDKDLSTIDNVVLHNRITGETHIAFRGTTDDVTKTGQFLSDWNTNRKIMFHPKAAETSTRFTEASAQTDRVIAKFGKRFTTFFGHSQGGGIYGLIGQEKHIRGFHFNPAISAKQVSSNTKGLFSKNVEKQVIFKTHVDFASPLAYTSPIRKT